MTETKAPDLERVAVIVKRAAREELLPRFTRAEGRAKTDGSIVTDADLAMQERLSCELLREWPGYALLGEEMGTEEQQRLLTGESAGLWVIDPLDGTSNFAAGFPLFGVSVALLVGGEPSLGVVYDPCRDECFTARCSGGAWLNGVRLHREAAKTGLAGSIAIVDFKRLPKPLAARLAAMPPYRSQRSLGSVVLEWCWLAAGRGELYLHGGQKLWDYAAAHLVFAEAGGASAGLDGEAVFRRSLVPRAVAAAADPPLLNAWLEWIGEEMG